MPNRNTSLCSITSHSLRATKSSVRVSMLMMWKSKRPTSPTSSSSSRPTGRPSTSGNNSALRHRATVLHRQTVIPMVIPTVKPMAKQTAQMAPTVIITMQIHRPSQPNVAPPPPKCCRCSVKWKRPNARHSKAMVLWNHSNASHRRQMIIDACRTTTTANQRMIAPIRRKR